MSLLVCLQCTCSTGLQKGRESQFHCWTDLSTFLPSATQLTGSRILLRLASVPGVPPQGRLLPGRGGLELIHCLKFPPFDPALEFSVWHVRSRLGRDLGLLNIDG